MRLTKSNYIQYINCPESLWLLKNDPDNYPRGEFSLFQEKLQNEGYEVEAYAQQLFPNGIRLDDHILPEETLRVLEKSDGVFFQASFETKKGTYAVIDVLEKNIDGSYNIYEVKSSSEIKTQSKNNLIKDASFQKYVVECNGLKVNDVYIIHLNRDYIKNGNIEPKKLLQISNITEELKSSYLATVNEIYSALSFLHKPLKTGPCSCVLKTRSHHCDAFHHFNPEIVDYSIYELNRLHKTKIKNLRDLGVLKIEDIPDNFNLTDYQALQRLSNIDKEPVFDLPSIQNELNDLEFPLHFFDYETYPSAIPKVDGLWPHGQLTFQVSVHSLSADGALNHFEYLADEFALPNQLLDRMEAFTGKSGHFISWHALFERDRNKEMISLCPEFREYLEFINANLFDLEKIFLKHYVDYRFLGKTSIKYVLPVLVPDLTYKDLNVQDGTMALDTWGRSILNPEEFENINKVRIDLLEYCKMDTLAMLKIYEKLHML